MPSFGRHNKHSTRSQAEQLPGGSGPGAVPGATTAQQPSGGSGAAVGGGGGAGISLAQADSPAESTVPLSALSSNTALSSSDQETFVDARPPPPTAQQQQQQQQQLQQQLQLQQQQHLQQLQQQQQNNNAQAPHPPPHLFSPHPGATGSSSPTPLQAHGGGGSPIYDVNQPTTPIEFAATGVGRSQSQRYDAGFPPHQQHQQQLYAHSSGSIDDLPGGAPYQQQQGQQPPPQQQAAPPPQKRSTRKLIKGIFGSSRDSHDNGQQHSQHLQQHLQQQGPGPIQTSQAGLYDNTAGLARRPSKRVSNPPNLKTSLSSATQAAQASADRDLLQPYPPRSSSQQPSPLLEVGEDDEAFYYANDSNTSPPPQDSRILLATQNARQASTEQFEATSPYDEVPYQQQPLDQQPQQVQRQGTLRAQDQASYDAHLQQQQQVHDDKFGRQQQLPQNFHYPTASGQGPYQQAIDPRLVPHSLVTNQQPSRSTDETGSQVSHDSPVTETDRRPSLPLAAPQSGQPSPDESSISQNTSGVPVTNNSTQDLPGMAPATSGSGQPPSRRAQEADKSLRGQVEPPPGPPPGYHRQGSVLASGAPSNPSNTRSPAYQGDRGSQFEAPPSGDQGRGSPQPGDRDAELEKQFKDLLTKYKNVKRLYFDGKAQIEQLNGQVEHLQNAVANQRMSQSRTAWDDNEYATRFNRLNGAINNLSFNIRKDWRSLPTWLDSYVSTDALRTGKQEMTAVGRAVMSRWIVEEVFNHVFHPGLGQHLSAQLKEIEMSIRGSAHTMHSQEEFDALTTKVVNWRMATLDGLQANLSGPDATENRALLTQKLTANLTAYLYQYLCDPPPAGVDGSTSMIAELAVAIAANLPLESRDVAIMYPLPGDLMQPKVMEVEKTGLPSLEGHKAETEDADSDSDSDEDRDNGGRSRADKGRSGTLKKKPPGPLQVGRKDSTASATRESTITDREVRPGVPKEQSRVRFAGFVALEVRGRQVLMKAPVWTL